MRFTYEPCKWPRILVKMDTSPRTPLQFVTHWFRQSSDRTTLERGAGCPKWEVFQGWVTKIVARHESLVGTSSVVRVSNRCAERHGFNSPWGLALLLCHARENRIYSFLKVIMSCHAKSNLLKLPKPLNSFALSESVTVRGQAKMTFCYEWINPLFGNAGYWYIQL